MGSHVIFTRYDIISRLKFLLHTQHIVKIFKMCTETGYYRQCLVYCDKLRFQTDCARVLMHKLLPLVFFSGMLKVFCSHTHVKLAISKHYTVPHVGLLSTVPRGVPSQFSLTWYLWEVDSAVSSCHVDMRSDNDVLKRHQTTKTQQIWLYK